MRIKAYRAALAALGVTAAAAMAFAVEPQASHDESVNRNLQTFGSIVKLLEANYVDSVRTDEVFKRAIAAMLDGVDPYTEFYNSEEQASLKSMTSGAYGGIGSYIMEREGGVYISEPYEGSPAAEAGLRPGDRIIRVDTTDTRGMKSDKVIPMLKGVPDTDVRIRVLRPYTQDSIVDVTVRRRKLVMPSVAYYGVVDGSTGYIKLTSFMERTPQEVRAALEAFKADPRVKNVVLDLRGNGGGLLSAAVETVNFFVPKNTVVLRTRGRDPRSEKVYKTTKNPLMPDIPLAVLIDGGSASASEITAGALQDLDRAVLVGSQSFGKGLVQSTFDLPYDGLLKVTVSKYYIPSGRLIQEFDYSRRNADGTVARTPDSLTNVFRTAAGREVRDGGGLAPDVKMEWDTPSPLLVSLVRDFHIFDFANRYAASHKEVPRPSEFEVTDEIYADFTAGLDTARLKYDRNTESLLEKLRKAAETEGYLNDSTKAALDSAARLLRHDAARDLQLKRKEIADYIGPEIMSRYYHTRGSVEYEARSDKGLARAIQILSDPKEYHKLLAAPKKKGTKR